jgi:hypothetical protein
LQSYQRRHTFSQSKTPSEISTLKAADLPDKYLIVPAKRYTEQASDSTDNLQNQEHGFLWQVFKTW